MNLTMAGNSFELNERVNATRAKASPLRRSLAYGVALALILSVPSQRAEARGGWGLAAGIGAALFFGGVMSRHAHAHVRHPAVARHHPANEGVREAHTGRGHGGRHHEEEPVEDAASSRIGPPPPASPTPIPTYSPGVEPVNAHENVGPLQPAVAPAEPSATPTSGVTNIAKTSSETNSAAPAPAPAAPLAATADGPGSADLH